MRILEDNSRPGCQDLVVLLADGTVEAEIEIYDRANGNDNYCVIYMWSSTNTGKGNTNKALAELREVTGYISVSAIGQDETCASWQYWVHQWGAKRVDLLTDDEGMIILKRDPGDVPRKPLDMLA
jgi:hypothetical protein